VAPGSCRLPTIPSRRATADGETHADSVFRSQATAEEGRAVAEKTIAGAYDAPPTAYGRQVKSGGHIGERRELVPFGEG
jgi:hypothetical protein